MSNKGTEKKLTQYEIMTTKPVEELLLSLSIPTILSMLITTLYNAVDAAFVGMLGTSQSAATGVVGGFMAILQAVAFMCGQGAGSLASRRLGQKNKKEATMYASSGLFLSFSLAVVIEIFSFIFLNKLITLLGSTESIAPYAKIYMFYILISAPLFTSSLTLNNILRYEGKAKFGTFALIIGGVLNIAGDAIFLCVLKLGIAGAGISTAISQAISFTIIISIFLRGKTETQLSLKYVARDIKVLFEIMATGFASLLRQGLNSVATMILNREASMYGDQAVAAMSIVSRLSFFPTAVAIGIGQGFQPISGFNFGAGKKDRVREAFFKAYIAGEIALATLSAILFIFAPGAVKLMRNDIEVIEIGTRALRIMCVTLIFLPLTMMVEMGFQSTGQKLYATISSSLRSGLIFIPTLIVMSRVRGLEGIEEAQPLSFVLAFGVCLYFLKLYLDMLKE